MDYDTRAILRGLGTLGATLAVLATFMAWYSFEVALAAGGVLHVFVVPVTLWNVTTLAPILIVAGSVGALVSLTLVNGRAAGIVTALVGLGITAYSIVRLFDVPALGVRDAAAIARGARAATTVEGGPALELASGILLLLGSLGDLLPAREEPAPARARAEEPRYQRGEAPAGREEPTRPGPGRA